MNKKIAMFCFGIVNFIVITALPLPAFAEPRIVSLSTIFNVEELIYTKKGELMVQGSSRSYRGNILRDELRTPGDRYLAMNLIGSNQLYLLDESCVYYDENVVDLGDGRVVMACQSGGNHCCSTFVLLIKNYKAGTLKVGGSRTIDHPELGISKESIRDIDSQGNMSIEVRGFTDRYDDEIEEVGYYPSFTYYIKVLKNGDVIVDKDPKSYEATIKKLKATLSKSYDFETYVQLVFYNRFLNLKLSESAYLTKASASDKGVATRSVKWVFKDMHFLNSIDDNGFAIKLLSPVDQ